MPSSESVPNYKSRPMPVTSLVKIDPPNEGDELDLVIQLGGYYYSKFHDYDTFEVVRLIDWRTDSCHFQFLGTANSIPTLEEVNSRRPVAWHMPVPLEYLFSANLVFVDSAPFTSEDLYGYKVYLEQIGWPNEEVEWTISDIIRQSQKKPLVPVHMVYRDGQVISQ